MDVTFFSYYGAIFHAAVNEAWVFTKAQGYVWAVVAALLAVAVENGRRGKIPFSTMRTVLSGFVGVGILVTAMFLYYLFRAPVDLQNKQIKESADIVKARDKTIVQLSYERDASNAEISRLNANHYKLQGSIDSVVFGDTRHINGGPSRRKASHPMSMEMGTAILLVATVRNLGEPTIVEDYRLSVEYKGARHETVSQKITSGEIDIGTSTNRNVFEGKDALYDKTGTTPVEPGQLARGILLFTLPKVDNKDLWSNAELILSFRDISATKYFATMTTDPSKASSRAFYQPGLHIEVLPR